MFTPQITSAADDISPWSVEYRDGRYHLMMLLTTVSILDTAREAQDLLRSLQDDFSEAH